MYTDALQSPEKQDLEETKEKGKSEEAIKAFIQMLEIKKDTNMTRVYSAIQFIRKDEDQYL